MAFNPEDCVGSIYKNTKGSEYKILKYNGKNDKKHMYEIKFTKTGNTYISDRAKVKASKTVKDTKHEADLKKQKKKEQIAKRKKMNTKPQLNKVYVDFKDGTTILALDQATKATGYAILKAGIIVEYGLIESDMWSAVDRMYAISSKIVELAEKHKVDMIVMEDIYMGYNVNTFKQLARLQGMIDGLCKNIGVKHIVYISAVIWKKKFNLLKGKKREAQKNAGKKMIEKAYGIKVETDDISDAMLIGIFAYTDILSEGFNFF